MPFIRPFVWAGGSISSALNLIVVIHARVDTASTIITGVGESAPRGPRLTGDDWNRIPQLMRAATERLYGLSIPITDPAASIAFVSGFMATVSLSIQSSSGSKCFRGSLSGVEMALLDLCARAQGLTLAELLGERRTEVRVSSPTFADTMTLKEVTDRLKIVGSRFPLCRLKGAGGDGSEDLAKLTRTAETYRELGLTVPLWIDINGAFSVDGARKFIDEISNRAREGLLPKELILEQPVAKAELKALCDLQAHADDRAAIYSGEIVIMADEAVWDSDDLQALQQAGGCRALNIKIQKAGGLLEALRTAELSGAQDPDRRIYIGGFPGTGDITAWAAVGLARALPRLDYFTSAPPNHVAHRIAKPLCRYAEDDSNLLAEQSGPGLGVTIDADALRPLVIAQRQLPRQVNRNP